MTRSLDTNSTPLSKTTFLLPVQVHPCLTSSSDLNVAQAAIAADLRGRWQTWIQIQAEAEEEGKSEGAVTVDMRCKADAFFKRKWTLFMLTYD